MFYNYYIKTKKENLVIYMIRSAKPFINNTQRRNYWIKLFILFSIGILFSYGLLVYKNIVPISSPSFIPVVQRRLNALIAMLIAAACQAIATITFQSVTNNRIITPSLLGFEAIYSTLHTCIIFFTGISGITSFTGIPAFLIQIGLMISVCILLYHRFLASKYPNLQLMLLVGVIIGTGLKASSSFMRKLLSPSEFDVLQAKLFGSVNNAEPEYFPLSIILIVFAIVVLYILAIKINIISMGKDISNVLGLEYNTTLIISLIMVSILMSISTTLVGPMTFYGFLVATLTYELANTYDHRYIFPMALAVGFIIITSAYFIMQHIFDAQGVVSIIIELIGGIIFLTMILRKGKF